MDPKVMHLLSRMACRAGASYGSLSRVEDDLDWTLPADYRAFLLFADGAEGQIGESYLHLWSTAEILENNLGYRIQKYLPRAVGIGSDLGGTAYAYDLRKSPAAIVSFDLCGFSEEDVELCALTFNSFLEWLQLS